MRPEPNRLAAWCVVTEPGPYLIVETLASGIWTIQVLGLLSPRKSDWFEIGAALGSSPLSGVLPWMHSLSRLSLSQ